MIKNRANIDVLAIYSINFGTVFSLNFVVVDCSTF
jgi:hypothetical protein